MLGHIPQGNALEARAGIDIAFRIDTGVVHPHSAHRLLGLPRRVAGRGFCGKDGLVSFILIDDVADQLAGLIDRQAVSQIAGIEIGASHHDKVG